MAEKDAHHSQDHNFDEFNTPVSDEARELLEKIEQSHEMRYKMMNLETWSLAKTMDAFLPGFWNRFLENRRTAMRDFIEQRRKMRAGEETNGDEFIDNIAPDSDVSPEELMQDHPSDETIDEMIDEMS